MTTLPKIPHFPIPSVYCHPNPVSAPITHLEVAPAPLPTALLIACSATDISCGTPGHPGCHLHPGNLFCGNLKYFSISFPRNEPKPLNSQVHFDRRRVQQLPKPSSTLVLSGSAPRCRIHSKPPQTNLLCGD